MTDSTPAPARPAGSPGIRSLAVLLTALVLATAAAVMTYLAVAHSRAGGGAPPPGLTLFQASTLNALAAGHYDGDLAFAALKPHGDFGLGTVNALDGEMIALDGQFYQIRTDGIATPVAEDQKTPFAMVTAFSPQTTAALAQPLDFRQLQAHLDGLLSDPNLIYAVKITGRFRWLKARSVPRQTPPYPSLAVAAGRQVIFEFTDVEGTIVGFRLPAYLQGVNLPGYHCHFLTADRRRGGHLLDCRMEQGRVEIAALRNLYLKLPTGVATGQDLSRDRRQELEKIEN